MISQAQIAQALIEKGIRPSIQRILILEHLIGVKSHPSADSVFEALSGSVPTLSKATVYNTLNLFAEKGIVRMITIDPVEKRFDGDLDTHAHFRCSICGSLEDVMVEQSKIEALSANLHNMNKITGTDVYFSGVCIKCQSK